MVHENDKSKRLSHMQNEMGRLMHYDEQELLSVWWGWHWDDNNGLIQSCPPKRDKKKWSTFVATRCTQESPGKCAYARPEGPIKTGWAETDKGQPGKPNVRKRWVAKEYKIHARPEVYAPTSQLEALKAVLLEIATGKRGG